MIRTLTLTPILTLAAGLTLAACATAPMDGPPPPSAGFNAQDFAWSARSGSGSVDGSVAYTRDGRTWSCTGAVGLTPETPYTRARFHTLYGSTAEAAIPAAIVRARTVQDASADYRNFVRTTQCDAAGRFRFDGLPDGGWFVITQVGPTDAPIALMERVETRGGRAVSVTLN